MGKFDINQDKASFDPETLIHNANSRELDITDVKQAEALLLEAEAATEQEHRMGLWKALKTYPKASAWSIFISFAVVMEGYDVILLGSFYAYPQFTRQFGTYDAASDSYQIPARWQAGMGNGANVGAIIGLMINGWAAERWGYRKTMMVSLVYMSCIIFLFFFAKNLPMILVAEIMCGIPWGSESVSPQLLPEADRYSVFQTLTTSYASEVAPVALRGYLTTWVNACWGIGQLISLGVLRGLLNTRTDQWGWRIPYALQWFWPIPLFLCAFFAPESPWWLVRKEKYAEARQSLKRLTSKRDGDDFDIDNTIAMMRHTNHLEKELSAGTSYLDCFKGVDLRRTEIVCGAWAVQQLCGSAFMSYSTYFFQQAGLSKEHAFDLSMGQYAINTGGTIICWFLMASNVGRRSLYLYGCCGMFISLFLIGGIGTIGSTAANWASAVMLLMWSVAYQFSVGTVAYALVAELSSRRLLMKSINLGRGLYCICGIVIGTITPYMLNPTAWNWASKSAFFWAGFCLLCILWIYFRLPEPTGLTYGELDKLFEMRVSARNFKKVGIDTFGRERQKLEQVKAAVGIGKAEPEKAAQHLE